MQKVLKKRKNKKTIQKAVSILQNHYLSARIAIKVKISNY